MIPRLIFLPMCGLLLLSGCASNDKILDEEFLTEREQKAAVAKTKMPQYFGFAAFPTKNGVGFRGEMRLHPNHMTSADFVKGDVPIIEMRGRASRDKMNVLLDLGSESSWLEFSSAERFNASFIGLNDTPIRYLGAYNTGRVNAFAGVITQLRIDQLFMENVPFYIRMARNSLGPLARGVLTPRIDAVLGYDNLKTFEYIQFNLLSGQVAFSASTPYIPHEELIMSEAPIRNISGHGLAIDGAIYGQPTPIVLDMVGDYHFARGDVKVASTKQVSLGDVVHRQVPTLLLPVSGQPPRAGRKMLENYIITICPRQRVVYFERMPE